MAKDDKKKKTEHEDVVDLAARIGARQSSESTPPEVVQRTIGVALQLPLGVPVGLAVANEQQFRHLQLG